MLGAAAGGALRYIVATALMQRFPMKFPIGTVVVNITGCFLIGFLMPLFLTRLVYNSQWRLFIVTGILGGYTTFSSFMWETLDSANRGERWIALANVVISVVLGYLAAWLGSGLSSTLVKR